MSDPDSQHMVALNSANEVRLYRSELKKQVKANEVDIRELISQPPPEIWSLEVFRLLCYQYRWKGTRARRAMRSLQSTESLTVGAMTARQRTLLVAEITRSQGPYVRPAVRERRAQTVVVDHRFKGKLRG